MFILRFCPKYVERIWFIFDVRFAGTPRHRRAFGLNFWHFDILTEAEFKRLSATGVIYNLTSFRSTSVHFWLIFYIRMTAVTVKLLANLQRQTSLFMFFRILTPTEPKISEYFHVRLCIFLIKNAVFSKKRRHLCFYTAFSTTSSSK